MPQQSPCTRRIALAAVVLAVLVVLLGACAGVQSRGETGRNGDRNGVAGVPAEILQPGAPEAKEGEPRDDESERDDPSEPGRPAVDTEIELDEYSPLAVFNLAYNQTFFTGGYWVEDHGFTEGDAVRWSITATRADAERGEFEAERALIRVNPDGTQWWYIRYSQDQYRFECELLLDEFDTPVEMWHRQEAGDEPSFYEFDYEQAGHFGEGDSADLRALEEAGISTLVYLTANEYRQALQGRVVLRVPAGEFEVDHLRYDFEDMQTGERFRYEWWVTPKVPGNLARFVWLDHQTERELAGELLEIVTGYRSPFEDR